MGFQMDSKQYTCRVTWSAEYNEYVGLFEPQALAICCNSALSALNSFMRLFTIAKS